MALPPSRSRLASCAVVSLVLLLCCPHEALSTKSGGGDEIKSYRKHSGSPRAFLTKFQAFVDTKEDALRLLDTIEQKCADVGKKVTTVFGEDAEGRPRSYIVAATSPTRTRIVDARRSNQKLVDQLLQAVSDERGADVEVLIEDRCPIVPAAVLFPSGFRYEGVVETPAGKRGRWTMPLPYSHGNLTFFLQTQARAEEKRRRLSQALEAGGDIPEALKALPVSERPISTKVLEKATPHERQLVQKFATGHGHESISDPETAVFAFRGEGEEAEVVGLLAARQRDEQPFDVRMFAAEKTSGELIYHVMFEKLLAIAKEKKIKNVSVSLDSSDTALLGALQGHGGLLRVWNPPGSLSEVTLFPLQPDGPFKAANLQRLLTEEQVRVDESKLARLKAAGLFVELTPAKPFEKVGVAKASAGAVILIGLLVAALVGIRKLIAVSPRPREARDENVTSVEDLYSDVSPEDHSAFPTKTANSLSQHSAAESALQATAVPAEAAHLGSKP